MATTINLALVGAGAWAKMQHLPAILENKDVELKAIYSRSKASAEALAREVPFSTEIYYDDPPTEDRTLDALLARDDIRAAVVCLPILVQLDVVRRFLEAGKHVQSEKPIAGDTATAAKFIGWYRDAQKSEALRPGLIWGVAEEFRLLPGLDFAQSEVARLGPVHTFSAQGFVYVGPGNPFYETSWRKVPGYQGGFLLDGGVHFTSGLLHMLGPKNRPETVSAFSNLLKDHLAPVDTLNAIVRLKNGVSGTWCNSAGIRHKPGPAFKFEVVCEKGSVTFQPGKGDALAVHVREEGQDEKVKESDGALNTRYELGTFVKSIQSGKEEIEETPERALDDLEFMQKMLESGEEKGAVKTLSYSS